MRQAPDPPSEPTEPYATGCPAEGRFVDNGNGTVSDTCTGLMWQQPTAPGAAWCQALEYCENLSLAGHDDWRLPNVRELQSIVDYGRYNPSIDPVFGALGPFYYWSSTAFDISPDRAWVVNFDYGGVSYDDKGSAIYVRAVRSGP